MPECLTYLFHVRIAKLVTRWKIFCLQSAIIAETVCLLPTLQSFLYFLHFLVKRFGFFRKFQLLSPVSSSNVGKKTLNVYKCFYTGVLQLSFYLSCCFILLLLLFCLEL